MKKNEKTLFSASDLPEETRKTLADWRDEGQAMLEVEIGIRGDLAKLNDALINALKTLNELTATAHGDPTDLEALTKLQAVREQASILELRIAEKEKEYEKNREPMAGCAMAGLNALKDAAKHDRQKFLEEIAALLKPHYFHAHNAEDAAAQSESYSSLLHFISWRRMGFQATAKELPGVVATLGRVLDDGAPIWQFTPSA